MLKAIWKSNFEHFNRGKFIGSFLRDNSRYIIPTLRAWAA